MLKIEKAQAVITSIQGKESPSPAPAKAGKDNGKLYQRKVVIEIDATDNPKMLETLFPGADVAIKLTAGDSDNKGWTQTAKTKPGSHSLTVRGSDGQQFELDCAEVKGGVQLKVSAQNSKKTNQATMVMRAVGRFTLEQKNALDDLLRADVKIWMKASQMDFADLSGETPKEIAKKQKEEEKAKKKAEKDAAKSKPDDVDLRPPALRAVP